MASSTTVPVTVSPEAQARVEELGLREEFELMVEHTLRAVKGVRSLEVEIDRDPEGGQAGVVLLARREGPETDYSADRDWAEWKTEEFQPAVFVHFGMMSVFDVAHDGR